MFRPLVRPAFALARRRQPPAVGPVMAVTCRRSIYTTTSGKKSDPLRILFCGSDTMSTEALHALHEEATYNPELVDKIEVVVLPPRNVGRGFKTRVIGEFFARSATRVIIDGMAIVPCMRAAQSLGLSYHEIDTFTDWEVSVSLRDVWSKKLTMCSCPRISISSSLSLLGSLCRRGC